MKILVLRLTSLGDVIFTLPLVNALEGNEIGYIVAEKGLEVIKNNPAISKVHFVPLKEWKKRPFSLKTFKEFFQIIKEIRKEKYDVALDCQQMFKSLFLFLFCGAKRRVTFKDARELSILAGNEFITPKAKFNDFNYHIVERNLDFARHLGIEPKEIKFVLPKATPEAKEKTDNLLLGLDKTKPTIAISPATTWKNKHWAEENWSQLLKEIKGKCNLIFTAMESDRELIQRLITKSELEQNDYIDLTGKTNVSELMEVFSRVNLVITPDSGSAHLAWSKGNAAVITIFTCTPAKRFGPYGNEKKYFSIQGQNPCQPCFKKKCKLKREKDQCCKSPAVEEIMNIVNNFL